MPVVDFNEQELKWLIDIVKKYRNTLKDYEEAYIEISNDMIHRLRQAAKPSPFDRQVVFRPGIEISKESYEALRKWRSEHIKKRQRELDEVLRQLDQKGDEN